MLATYNTNHQSLIFFQRLNSLQKMSQTEGVELMTLRKACQLQKQDLEHFEMNLSQLRREVEITRYHKDTEPICMYVC